MKLAIVGTKSAVEYSVLKDALDKFNLKPSQIISTGEKGVAELASLHAKYTKLKHLEVKANWKDIDVPGAVVKTGPYGDYNSRAGIDRDNKILACVDAILIVEPNGDKNFIESNARKSGKKVYVYNGEHSDDEQVAF